MIAVVDVGLGNVASVGNMLRRIGVSAASAATPDDWDGKSAIVLPGVGSYDTGVTRLTESGWFDVLRGLPTDHPILGICLGMQLLTASSQEGQLAGLGRIPAHCDRLPDGSLPVPHMGWNEIGWDRQDPVFGALPDKARFYFTHSYRAICDDPANVVATAEYGSQIVAAFKNGSTYGTQFHPEKSHRFGMALLTSWRDALC